jgi:hypothetical protein
MPVILVALKIAARYIKAWVDVAVDGAFYWLSRYILHGLAARTSLKAYCRSLLASTRYVPVPSTRDINLEIDNIFVTLNLENAGISQRGVTHSTILSTGNRLRLVGDPGSGKSCLIKRLLRDAAQVAIKKPSKARLPIVFELRNISIPLSSKASKAGDWLYQKLRSQAETINVHRMADCFDTYAAGPGLLVLLDGLDEIASTQYERAQDAIRGLAGTLDAKGPNNVVVLTSRTQFHHQVRDAYVATYPSVFHLKPFTPTDIYEFLTRWPFHENARSQVNRIYRDLTDRPTLRELCGNPLILSMYVAEGEGTAEQLVPDSRTEFYSRVADELLVNRRVRQTGQQAGRTALRDLREQVLGELAFDHLLDITQPANSLDWSKAISTLAKRLNITSDAAELAFAELSRETGLFTIERPRETFRFIHLTLCEFFAAAEAVKNRKTGWTELIAAQQQHLAGAASDRQRLLEVIPFACGLLHRVHREEAITAVAELGDNRLLARCLLETKLYAHPAWRPFIMAAYRALIVHKGAWDEEWLFDFHLFNVVVRDATTGALHTGVSIDAPDLDEVLREVVATQEEGLARLIDTYAEKDAAAVFRVAELAGIDLVDSFPEVVIQSLDQRPFMELLLERSVNTPKDAGKWSAVFAEAGLRSRPVAKDLDSRPPAMAWIGCVTTIPKRRQWIVPGLLRPSLYTQCLTIGANSERQQAGWLLGIIARMPAPSRYTFLVSRYVPPLLALTVFVAGAVIPSIQPTVMPGRHGVLFLTAGLAIILPFVIYPLMFLSLSLRHVYVLVTGVHELSQRVDRPNTRIAVWRLFRRFLPRRLRATASEFAARKQQLAPVDTDAEIIQRLID